jgi:predicted NAD/FAD-binding protein
VGYRIAIIGTGISGLGAAWALSRDHDITVFEAEDRLGGHSNTVDVSTPLGSVPVDTGFIVYNEVTYPNLTRLFGHLGVATEESNMSFSFSANRRFEYGASLRGVLSSPPNLARKRFRSMLTDINRFRRIGQTIEARPNESIREVLERYDFSPGFIDDYMFPMTGAIWSSPRDEIAKFPARSILRFMANHGLIDIVGRPRWRTVTGGSSSYVELLSASFADRIRLGSPVQSVVRAGSQVIVSSAGNSETFDHVLFANHSDQALRVLGSDATEAERKMLGDIEYTSNTAVLHSDVSQMPRRRSAWSSWNAMSDSGDDENSRVSLTYWMNRLQNLDPSYPLLVTLNPNTEPDPRLTHARFEYAHPRFDNKAIEAQEGIAHIQGMNQTWFVGAYLGYGFHEDGLQSGLNVAAALGSPAPWHGSFAPVSSARPPTLLSLVA